VRLTLINAQKKNTMRMGTGIILTLTNAQSKTTMTIGTAEYIREHVYRDCPHY